ncbi:MAG TPA: sigma-70 family RNA polymerase sigma factor [Bacteroidia bacterium]|nr:sigma-70 family RNA polymerase sigma factor [Bacteroidia bacterium]
MKPEQTETYKIISRGGKESVSLLYERYGKKLFAYAVHSWKTTEDESWELVYKTLYRVMETAGKYSFDSEKNFSSFVFKVFVNFLRQHYRDVKRKNEHLGFVEMNDSVLQQNSAPEKEDAPETENMARLKTELEKLEDWERMLLLLRSQDMPYADIAKYVDRPEEHLKVYYQRLKASLAKKLNETTHSKNTTDEN